jgi:hypothetical protein
MASKLIRSSQRLTFEITAENMAAGWDAIKQGVEIIHTGSEPKPNEVNELAAFAGCALFCLRELGARLLDVDAGNFAIEALGRDVVECALEMGAVEPTR